ncbi:MAG: NAD(P)H-dependent oxidoreductase subunit E [Cyclobacteriaceae bacterium]|nr:NAD(P)H-dependent oxidoreductase subunit E [Cyclobacteriaceae bacterium]
MSKNLSYLAGRKGVTKTLFEELGIAAAETGTPSVEKMEALRKEFLVGKANVYGTATFYDFLKPENRGKKVYVCNGSACLCAGTQPALKETLQHYFKEEEIGEMCCLGRCHENAAFHYGGKNYSGNAIDTISEIKKNKTVVADNYHIASEGTAVLTKKIPGLEAYYQILKDCLKKPVAALQTELKASGLRGRGGAGFPVAIKLESCRNTEANQRFIVCNADEGDPGAYSDRYLLEHQPHAVLMGMIIAGYLADASVGVLYIRAEYPESIEAIEKAIQQLRDHKFIGENIFGSGFSFRFKVIKAQGAYICGEETALLSSIEGQRPEVRVRPPYPAQQGLFNLPTVVNNVETLANLPFIMQHGGKAFASIGTPKSTGTKLISLDGHFNKPGIYEVDMGTPLRVVVNELGGGFRKPVKAMHIGGPLGGLVPVSKINDLTIDFESFSNEGFLLGHASIVCIPEDFPLLLYIEHLFEFTAHESCGKCFPCRLGSTRGKEMLQKARTGNYKIDRNLLNDLLETLEIGSLCMLGGGLPLPVKNALQYFEDELKPYFITNV